MHNYKVNNNNIKWRVKNGEKSFCMFLCIVLVCSVLSGCGASSGNKKISVSVNFFNQSISTTKVNFYDFYHQNLIKNFSGKMYIISGFYTKSITCTYGNTTRVICMNNSLGNKPKNLKIYTNKGKTKGDNYTCKY